MKLITFSAPDGRQGVIVPAESARLSGETDNTFAARIMAKDLPAGATNAQIIDAASYVPPPPPTPKPILPTPRQWLERLSATTQAAITAAAVKDQTGALLLWLLRAAGNPAIDVTHAETQSGVGALLALGIITPAEQAILLAP